MKSRVLAPYDLFLIAGVIVCNVLYSILSRDFDPIGSLASIAGVFCVVLVAKGSIWNYLFGVINVSLYAWISYKAAIYGDAALNALYYFPMQFIGWWQWRKRGATIRHTEPSSLHPEERSPHVILREATAGSDEESHGTVVKARRMNWPQRLLLALGCALLIIAGMFLLRYLGDPQPLKDSTTTVLSIIAQALMALAFMEQWALWIIVNAVSVTMWCVCIARGESHAAVMVIMWVFYLLNSINGLRVWLKLSRQNPV